MKPAVYFIGAGPGDPELLTMKAYRILKNADVVFYADSLVPKQILQDTKADAELISTSSKILEDIIPSIKAKVEQGAIVVRLQSGDLSLYSAIQEQMQLLAEADIPFELIPGISAYQAAAAKINTELTIPELVQTIILTRVSGSASAVPEKEELASLASHQASLCLYLSARHIEKSQSLLLEHYPKETPVAICYRVGWSDEKITIVPLENISQVTQEEKMIRTVLYIVSPALQKLDKFNFRSRLYHPQHRHIFRPR